jgi:hypothetical protein
MNIEGRIMISTKDEALRLIGEVCAFAGPRDFIGEIQAQAKKSGLAAAIDRHDTAFLFDRLMRGLSYQGISDRISDAYIAAHGNPSLGQVQKLLESGSSACPLLQGFDTFRGCGYRKAAQSCSNPTALKDCPVPKLPLRKGGLNQLSFSLALFIRDQCEGDLAGYIDHVMPPQNATAETFELAKSKLVEDFSTVHAVSAKLASMVLAEILLAGGSSRPNWLAVGSRLIAIDSLVHNFLHRTGILAAFERPHLYGPVCHGGQGCEEVIGQLSRQFDARSINPDYPADFPRFVQFSIWRFCSEGGFGICNGRQIDDRMPCERTDCIVGTHCSRLPLHPERQIMVEIVS